MWIQIFLFCSKVTHSITRSAHKTNTTSPKSHTTKPDRIRADNSTLHTEQERETTAAVLVLKGGVCLQLLLQQIHSLSFFVPRTNRNRNRSSVFHCIHPSPMRATTDDHRVTSVVTLYSSSLFSLCPLFVTFGDFSLAETGLTGTRGSGSSHC